MKRYAISLMLIVASTIAVSTTPNVPPEEYRVLACILDSFYSKPNHGPYFIIDRPIANAFDDLSAEAAFLDQRAAPDSSLYPLLNELIANGRSKKNEEVLFKHKLKARTSYRVKSLKKNSSSLDINDIYRSYPTFGGIIEFSRVGFSNDGRFALVITTIYQGPQDAGGNNLLLEKQGNNWRIIKRRRDWVS